MSTESETPMPRPLIQADQETLLRLTRENTNLKAVIKNDCETEEVVKNLARPIIGELLTDGDSICAPNEADIVESLIAHFQKENTALKLALRPFCSGIEPLNWGKIKAHLPTDLARSLNQFNMAADVAISATPTTAIDGAISKESEQLLKKLSP